MREIYLVTIYQAYLKHLLSGYHNHAFLKGQMAHSRVSKLKVSDSQRVLAKNNFNE